MIEIRTQPGVGAMTKITGARKARGRVVGIGSGLEIVGVAGIALGRKTNILSAGSAGVAGVAIDRCVRPS